MFFFSKNERSVERRVEGSFHKDRQEDGKCMWRQSLRCFPRGLVKKSTEQISGKNCWFGNITSFHWSLPVLIKVYWESGPEALNETWRQREGISHCNMLVFKVSSYQRKNVLTQSRTEVGAWIFLPMSEFSNKYEIRKQGKQYVLNFNSAPILPGHVVLCHVCFLSHPNDPE